MRSLLLFFTIFLSPNIFSLAIPSEYRSGRDVCNSVKRPKEYGVWLEVPIDYKNEESGTTELFAWTKKPFDPLKKTAIFVSGGPGDTAHKSYLELSEWNIVFFDQRGNSCSRPATQQEYLNPKFYSSENTARDIDEIRKVLGVEKVSIYGVSYGTVVGHLYGHYFPETTRGVVLEGVVFRGGISLMRPKSRTRTLQDFFLTLSNETQQRILELSNNPLIARNWFSNVGMMMLYMDNPLEVYKTFLENTIFNDEVLYPLLKSFEKGEVTDLDYGYGHVMMGMIGCQELGMNLEGVSFYSVFDGQELVSDNINSLNETYCKDLGLDSDKYSNLYDASKRPSHATTTYIQGSLDGATSARGALSHYEQATKGFSQFILVGNGGHAPLHGPISSGYEKGPAIDLRHELLRSALLGEEISEQQLGGLSRLTSLGWILH